MPGKANLLIIMAFSFQYFIGVNISERKSGTDRPKNLARIPHSTGPRGHVFSTHFPVDEY